MDLQWCVNILHSWDRNLTFWIQKECICVERTGQDRCSHLYSWLLYSILAKLAGSNAISLTSPMLAQYNSKCDHHWVLLMLLMSQAMWTHMKHLSLQCSSKIFLTCCDIHILWSASVKKRVAASLPFLFLSHTLCISVCVQPKSRCSGFQRHVCLFFGSLDFVNFDTLPISFSLMSLFRDSKGKLAMLASLGRRLANNSLLYLHTMSVCLSTYTCCLLFVH